VRRALAIGIGRAPRPRPLATSADADSSLDHLKSEGDINLSPRRALYAERNIAGSAATQSLLRRDADVFLHQSLSTPCLNGLARADGLHIEDLEGRRYMDFHGNSVHQVGFGHPAVVAAIKDQLDALPFCTRRFTNDRAVELAETLTGLAPDPLNRVLFAPGGAAAIGMALKLARYATGRHKTISMFDSFHGASLDCISIGGEQIFRGGVGPLMPGTHHVPPPDDYRADESGFPDAMASARYVEYVLEKEGDIAAVVAEPVRWMPYVPPPEYWRAVKRACERHGALLILDEIPNSLGRTGTFFTFERFGIVPDMCVLGKGLGGGVMPIAALLASEALNGVCATKALGHYTHEKSPVACAAGLATIRTILDEGLMENAAELGAWSMERMRSMMARHPLIGDVRGIGLLLGIELVEDRGTKKRAFDAAEQVMYACLERGLSFKLTMGNIITLCPPLTVTRAEMEGAFDIIEEALASVEERA
jgi:4-aminobutyrate aminotransferase